MKKLKIGDGSESIVKKSAIFFVFSIINKSIPFALLPFLTAYIEPKGYGIIAVMALVSSLCMPLVGLCSNMVLFQRFFKLNAFGRSNFINDAYKIIFINAIIILFLSFFLADFVEIFLKIPIIWFQVAVLCAATGMVSNLTGEFFLLQSKPVHYGLFMTASALMNSGLALLFVVYFKYGWEGRGISLLISGFCLALIAITCMHKFGQLSRPGLNITTQGHTIIRLGSRLIPSAVGGWLLVMIDRVILTSVSSLELVGIYAVGIMLAQIVDILLNSLSRMAQPILAQYGLSENMMDRVMLVRGIYIFFAISMLSVVVLSILSPIILDLMVDKRYHGALGVVFWVSLGFAFANLGGIFLNLILVTEKNIVTGYISAATFCFSVVCAYFLINYNGIIGAAWANALSGLFNLTLFLVVCQIYNPLPWLDKRILIAN